MGRAHVSPPPPAQLEGIFAAALATLASCATVLAAFWAFLTWAASQPLSVLPESSSTSPSPTSAQSSKPQRTGRPWLVPRQAVTFAPRGSRPR